MRNEFLRQMCPYIDGHIGLQRISSSDKFRVPTTKVLYGQFGEEKTLRAFKISGVLYGEHVSDTFLIVNVAGLGEGYICACGTFYESKEDYLRGAQVATVFTDTSFSALEMFARDMHKLGTLVQYPNQKGYRIHRYAWKDNRADWGVVKLLADYDVETMSLSITVSSQKEYPYATEEDCIRDNQVDVVEFDGATEPAKKEFLVDLPKQVKVTARTEDEAKQIAQNALQDIIK